jgi:hypothetical protein
VGVFYLLYINSNTLLIGFVTGLLVCIRPEGLTLLGPAILVGTVRVLVHKNKKYTLIGLFIGFIIPLLFYSYHNYSITGALLPNTFFAKAAEYGSLRSQSLVSRFLNLSTVLISGAGLFLIPGFLRATYEAAKKRDIWQISIVLWVIGFLLIYAIRLPVIYQHGRYVMPVIPMFSILGFFGTIDLISKLKPSRQKFYKLVALGTLLVTSLLFWVQGVFTFSADVQVINKLMVEPAIWLREHTDSESVVAAHDIGAIGYFSRRRIIDLAGLIDPKVVPFINDESRLMDFIEESGADYLVVFSDWYRVLGRIGFLEKEFTIQQNDLQKTVVIRKLR